MARVKPIKLALTLLLHWTCHFFHNCSCDYRLYLLRLPTEGWPGWVSLGGWLNRRMMNGRPPQLDKSRFIAVCRAVTTNPDHRFIVLVGLFWVRFLFKFSVCFYAVDQACYLSVFWLHIKCTVSYCIVSYHIGKRGRVETHRLQISVFCCDLVCFCFQYKTFLWWRLNRLN